MEDLRHLVKTDRKLEIRAFDLIEAILRDLFEGIGKPKPLKYLAPGCWSRRLTQEHRIVYLVREGRIDFLQARYHYWRIGQDGWEISGNDLITYLSRYGVI